MHRLPWTINWRVNSADPKALAAVHVKRDESRRSTSRIKTEDMTLLPCSEEGDEDEERWDRRDRME